MQSVSPRQATIDNCDIKDFPSLQETILIYAACGNIYSTVHSAGINSFTTLITINWVKYKNIMDTNLFAGIEMLRIMEAKKLIVPKSSHVFISSVVSKRGIAGLLLYATSKAALNGAVKSLALELLKEIVGKCN